MDSYQTDIRVKLAAAGRKQVDLARACNIRYSTLTRWINGYGGMKEEDQDNVRNKLAEWLIAK